MLFNAEDKVHAGQLQSALVMVYMALLVCSYG